MIEERYIELIQAEVDGELSEGERAELARYLLAHPEARAARDDLRRVCEVLDRVPSVEPPAGLADLILAAARVPAAPVRPVRRGFASWQPGVLRYAAVFVGGLLAGAIAFHAGDDGRPGLDVADVSGTMVAGDPVMQSLPVDSVQVALEQVSGTVRLFQSPSMRVVEFELEVRQPVEVVVGHDGQEARFSGFGPSAAGGSDRYALVLAGPGKAGEPVKVRFLAGGTTVHEDELRVPAAPAG